MIKILHAQQAVGADLSFGWVVNQRPVSESRRMDPSILVFSLGQAAQPQAVGRN